LSNQSKEPEPEEDVSIATVAKRVALKVFAVYVFVWLMNKI
jgi:hypothetical protein